MPTPRSASDPSYGPTVLKAEGPQLKTQQRSLARQHKSQLRTSAEQTLQYRTQLSSGQDNILHVAFIPTTSQIVSVDSKALRLWSLRREVRSFSFPGPVRIINVHYVQSVDRIVCLYVELVPIDAEDSKSRTTKKSRLCESEHAAVQVFLPSLVPEDRIHLTQPGDTSAANANNSGDIVTSDIFQATGEIVTGSRSGDVSVWTLAHGGSIQVSKAAGVILEGKVDLVSVNESSQQIAAAGGRAASCIDYRRSVVEPDGQMSEPTLIKKHDHTRGGDKVINVSSLQFVDGSSKILLGYADGAVFCWDYAARPLKVREHHGLHATEVTDLANLSGNGDYFSCGRDGKIGHWSLSPHVMLGEHSIPIPVQHEHVFERDPILPIPQELCLGKVSTSSASKQLLFVVAGNAILVIEVVAPQIVLAQYSGKSIVSVVASHCKPDDPTVSTSEYDPEHSELLTLTDDNNIERVSMVSGPTSKSLPIEKLLSLRDKSIPAVPRPSQHHGDSSRFAAITRISWDPSLKATFVGCSDGVIVLVAQSPVFFIPPQNSSEAVSALCKLATLRKEPDALRHSTIPSVTFLVSGTSEGRLHCWKMASVQSISAKQRRGKRSRKQSSKTPFSRGKLVGSNAAHTTKVIGVAGFHCNAGTYFVSGSMDGAIKVWEMPKMKMANFFYAFDNDGVSLSNKPQLTAISPLAHMHDTSTDVRVPGSNASPPHLVCGMANGSVIVWSLPQPGYPPATKPETVHLQHHQRVTGLALSPPSVSQDLFFLSCSLDQSVVLWSGKALQPLKVFALSSPLIGVTFSFDGSIVAYGAAGIFTIRGPKTKRPQLTPQLDSASSPKSRALSREKAGTSRTQISANVPTLPTIGSVSRGTASPDSAPSSARPAFNYEQELLRVQLSNERRSRNSSRSGGFGQQSNRTPTTPGSPTDLHKANQLSALKPAVAKGRAPMGPSLTVRRKTEPWDDNAFAPWPKSMGDSRGQSPVGRLTPTVGIGDYGIQAEEPIVLSPPRAALQPGASQKRRQQAKFRPHKLSTMKRVVRDIHGEPRIIHIPIDDIHQEATARAKERAAKKIPPSTSKVDHHQHHNPAKRFNPDLTDSEEEDGDSVEEFLDLSIPTDVSPTTKGNKTPAFPDSLKKFWFVEPVYEIDPVTGLTRKSSAPPVYPELGQTKKLSLLPDLEFEIWSIYIDVLSATDHGGARLLQRQKEEAATQRRSVGTGLRSGLLSVSDAPGMIYKYFLRRHGVQQLAQQKLLRLLDSVVAYRKKSIIAQIFAKLLGLFSVKTRSSSKPDSYSPSTFSFFMSILNMAGNDRCCLLWPSARQDPYDPYGFDYDFDGDPSPPAQNLDRSGLEPVNKDARSWIGKVQVYRKELASCVSSLLSGGHVHPDMLAQLCAQLNPRAPDGGVAGSLQSSQAMQALNNGAFATMADVFLLYFAFRTLSLMLYADDPT